jgi:TatA/E family protein of Tat protein translocase
MFTSILEPSHLIIILIVALVLFGPKRLPEAGRALGQGLKESGDYSGEERQDQRSVGKLHDRKASRESDLCQAPELRPSSL